MEKAIRRAKKEGKIAKTAQQTIPYEEMYPDGICRITNRLYSKSVLCDDINYAEASDDEKAVLFELYCKLVNYFGPSVGFELSVICYPADLVEYRKMLALNPQGDQFDEIRKEYSDMLVRQVSKSRYERRICLTYTIEADGIRQARSRLEQIDNDVVGHFRALTVAAHPMDGYERLTILHRCLHLEENRKFRFNWDSLNHTGLSSKDYIAPSSFFFKDGRYFRSGASFGAVSFLQIRATKLYDTLLNSILNMEGSQIVSIHAKALDQNAALKAVKRKLSDLDKAKIDEQNVNVDNRVACYDISGLGQNLKKPGMLTVQNNIWQRTIVNRYAGKTTRIYLDEFHLLLKEPQTAAYTAEIYKRFRKWNGIPTSLTQNVKDLLESPEIENILENSDFILMLNQAASDRNILAQRLGISPQELGHITNSDAGEGLLFFGDKIIPFVDKFPTDTKLYQVMTTKPADLAA